MPVPIVVNLDVMLAKRKRRLGDLAGVDQNAFELGRPGPLA